MNGESAPKNVGKISAQHLVVATGVRIIAITQLVIGEA
jgi:hypothetical protein